MIEDYPLSLKVVVNGIKIHLLDKICIKYRIDQGNISTDPSFSEKYKLMFERIAIPIIKKEKMFFLLYHYDLKKWRDTKANIFPFSNLLFRRLLNATDIYSWKKFFNQFCVSLRCVGKSKR